MGSLFDILAAPIMLPTKGLLFIFDKITEQVNNELLDDSNIRLQLLELQGLLDSGKITEDEFYEMEEELLDNLDAILAFKEDQQKQGASDDDDEDEDENEDEEDDEEDESEADRDLEEEDGLTGLSAGSIVYTKTADEDKETGT